MPIIIRKAVFEDKEQVLGLYSKLPSRHRSDEFRSMQGNVDRVYRKIIENPSLGLVLVAELNETIMGVISLFFPVAVRSGGPYARIEEYIVDEASRGKGIGGQLLDEAIRLAKKNGCFDLQVNNPSDLGKPLYDKRGFVDAGEYMRFKL